MTPPEGRPMETLSKEPRVVFGVGAESAVAELLAELGARRVLVVGSGRRPEAADRLRQALGERFAGWFPTDVPQVPAEVAARAVGLAADTGADWVLAHGGGTPIGVAKAVALELPVKVAAIPTTYAGSERTTIWGIVRHGAKTTGRDPRVLPSLVIYDPSLTVDLPRELSLHSLFNALAHSVAALDAVQATDAARAAAAESLAPLVAGMRAIAADPTDLDGRAHALRGAALAAAALDGASLGLHHKLAHVLGGDFATPHAATHAALLPYTAGFQAPTSPSLRDWAFRAWNTRDPGAFLYDLARSFGLETSLRSLGLAESQLPAIAERVVAARYTDRGELDVAALHELLLDALHDRRPSLASHRPPWPS
jgi:maleylacetate reductase